MSLPACAHAAAADIVFDFARIVVFGVLEIAGKSVAPAGGRAGLVARLDVRVAVDLVQPVNRSVDQKAKAA